MPSPNALHFLQLISRVLTWCTGRTVVTGNGLWIAKIGVIVGLP